MQIPGIAGKSPGAGVMGENGQSAVNRIERWQDSQTALVHAGGLAEASWGVDSGWNLDKTYIDPAFAFRQDGYVRKLALFVNANDSIDQTAIFKVFRLSSGTTYNFVAEQNIPIPHSAIGTQKLEIILNPPIAVLMGDVPGIRFYNAGEAEGVLAVKALASTVRKTRLVDGNITSQTNFSTEHASHICLECFMYRPYLVMTGDSINAGHNGATGWYSGLENTTIPPATTPGGEPTSEIGNQLRGLIGSGTVLQYQNLSLGSQTYSWVATTGIVSAHAILPKVIHIHCGFNDVYTDREWSAVEANLDTIKAAITTERLLVDEILPSSNFSDAQAAVCRTFNTNLAAWCAANNVTLIPCWAAFGQLRASTGYNDDFIAALTQDGTHLSTAGVQKLAGIIRPYI